ncbi:MAG: hypothetical protein KC561_06220 [Myxococcales bacterium]|nr:hypothetical protein [Myxococcales bacterium]
MGLAAPDQPPNLSFFSTGTGVGLDSSAWCFGGSWRSPGTEYWLEGLGDPRKCSVGWSSERSRTNPDGTGTHYFEVRWPGDLEPNSQYSLCLRNADGGLIRSWPFMSGDAPVPLPQSPQRVAAPPVEPSDIPRPPPGPGRYATTWLDLPSGQTYVIDARIDNYSTAMFSSGPGVVEVSVLCPSTAAAPHMRIRVLSTSGKDIWSEEFAVATV